MTAPDCKSDASGILGSTPRSPTKFIIIMIISIFKVYWTDVHDVVRSEIFHDMTQALNYTQYLRADGNKHVVLSSDISGNVTKLGVAEVDSDYNWKKRRA